MYQSNISPIGTWWCGWLMRLQLDALRVDVMMGCRIAVQHQDSVCDGREQGASEWIRYTGWPAGDLPQRPTHRDQWRRAGTAHRPRTRTERSESSTRCLACPAERNTRTHRPYTRLTALCPGLPGWAGTRKVKRIGILLKQETVMEWQWH